METNKQNNDYYGSMAVLEGSRAVVTVESSTNLFETGETLVSMPQQNNVEYREAVPWGANNNFPAELRDLLESNIQAMSSLEHNNIMAYGSGIKIGYRDDNDKFVPYTRKEKRENKKLREAIDFIEDNNLDEYLSELISDINWFYQGFVEIILNKELSKINVMQVAEAMFSRYETANEDGVIEHHFYSSKWKEKPKAEEYTATKVLFSKNKVKELEINLGRRPDNDGKIRKISDTRYIIPIRMPYPGNKYYPKPYYYSAIKGGWLDLSNAIPRFKKAMMNNSMTIKYHVEISKDYFPRLFSREGIKDRKEQKIREKKEFEYIDNYLKGVDSAGKSMISYFGMNNTTEVSDIKIKVLDTKVGGEYLKDSHEATAMILFAFRVQPSLLGVIPGETSSNLSGNDKRQLFNIAGAMQHRLRSAVLKPLYLVKKINGWDPEIEFAIANTEITTLDEGTETTQVII